MILKPTWVAADLKLASLCLDFENSPMISKFAVILFYSSWIDFYHIPKILSDGSLPAFEDLQVYCKWVLAYFGFRLGKLFGPFCTTPLERPTPSRQGSSTANGPLPALDTVCKFYLRWTDRPMPSLYRPQPIGQLTPSFLRYFSTTF